MNSCYFVCVRASPLFHKLVIFVSRPVSEVQRVSQQDNEQSAAESRDSNKYQAAGTTTTTTLYFILLIFTCRFLSKGY